MRQFARWCVHSAGKGLERARGPTWVLELITGNLVSLGHRDVGGTIQRQARSLDRHRGFEWGVKADRSFRVLDLDAYRGWSSAWLAKALTATSLLPIPVVLVVIDV